MGRLLNLLIILTCSTASVFRDLDSHRASVSSILSDRRIDSTDFRDVFKELNAKGKVAGVDAEKLLSSFQEFMILLSPKQSWWRRTSLDLALSVVTDRVWTFLGELGSTSSQRIENIQIVMDYLLLGVSIQPMDESLLTSSIYNVLFLFDWVSDSMLDESSIPVLHRKLVHTMKDSRNRFLDQSAIPSVFASLIQFQDKTIEFLYMECLNSKTTSSDTFLSFVNKQLTYDKLAEFTHRRPRSVHGEMYTRLFSACDSVATALSHNLLTDMYSSIIDSDDFKGSRDFVQRTDVERSLVRVVLLSYELAALIPGNVPNVLEYLLWCLTMKTVGKFPDTNIDDLITFNDVMYQIRSQLDDLRLVSIETLLLKKIGIGFDHSNMMLKALGLDTDKVCESRFGLNYTLVTHCEYVVNIVHRGFEISETPLVLEAGLTRQILMGLWYLLRIINSGVFITNPGCVDRSVMTLDAFIIKCKRETAQGDGVISDELIEFLARVVETALDVLEVD